MQRAPGCLYWQREAHRIGALIQTQHGRFRACRDEIRRAHVQGDHTLMGAAVEDALASIRETQKLIGARQRALSACRTLAGERKATL
jgi:hypothetical protein